MKQQPRTGWAQKIKVARYPKIWQRIIFLVLFCCFFLQILEEREGVVYEVDEVYDNKAEYEFKPFLGQSWIWEDECK